MTKRELLTGCSFSELQYAIDDKVRAGGPETVRGCLGKASMDEPLFVLRSKDMLAPPLVEFWANLADLHGCPKEKVLSAISEARAMEEWPDRKWPD